MNHTKGPWEVAHYEDGILEGVNFIRSTVNNYSVCILINGGTSPEETEANAAFIVRACNSHEELIEELKTIKGLSKGWDEDGSTGPRKPYSWETIARIAMDVAVSALAKVEGKP